MRTSGSTALLPFHYKYGIQQQAGVAHVLLECCLLGVP